jgi:hypothetical protein
VFSTSSAKKPFPYIRQRKKMSFGKKNLTCTGYLIFSSFQNPLIMKALYALLLMASFFALSACEKESGSDQLAPEAATVDMKFLVGRWAQHETRNGIINLIPAGQSNASGMVFEDGGHALSVQFTASEKYSCGTTAGNTTASAADDEVKNYMKVIEAGKWSTALDKGVNTLRIDFAKTQEYKVLRLNRGLLQLQVTGNN